MGMNIVHGSADESVDVGAGCALSGFLFLSSFRSFFFGWRGFVVGVTSRAAVQTLLLFLPLHTFIMHVTFGWW